MRHRARIFGRWCAPAVRAQTVRDFRWLLLIDPATPSRWRLKILALADFPRASLVEVPITGPMFPDGNTGPAICDAVRPWLDSAADLLLTTRLDNDDVCHARAIERIRRAAAEATPPAVLDFTRFWRRGVGGMTIHEAPTGSALISLVEPGGPTAQTVYCDHHAKLGEHAPIERILDGPWWMYLVHDGTGGNSSVRSLRGRRVRPRTPPGFPTMTAARFLALTPGP